MWLSDASVKRPVFASVINLLVVIFRHRGDQYAVVAGISGYRPANRINQHQLRRRFSQHC